MKKQPVAKLTRKKLSDYTQDKKNFNLGNDAGNALIAKSVHEFGAGRSLLASSDGVLIAGNKSHKNFEEAGIKNVIEVETDGSTVVVVKRTDIKSGTKKFHELALADNQSSAVDYTPDMLMMEEVAAEYEIDVLEWGVEPESDESERTVTFQTKNLSDGRKTHLCPNCQTEFDD